MNIQGKQKKKNTLLNIKRLPLPSTHPTEILKSDAQCEKNISNIKKNTTPRTCKHLIFHSNYMYILTYIKITITITITNDLFRHMNKM